MRNIINATVAGAIALTAVGAAAADPPRRGHDRDRYDRHDRYDRYDRHDRRWDNGHRWRRGDYFDHRRTHYVVVRDYHRYRLAPPRRGEYYARTDSGDIILVAAATGLILWALTN